MTNWKIGAHRELLAGAAALLLIVVAGLIVPAEALASSGSDTDLASNALVMTGDAMAPAIPRGALLISGLTDPGDVRVGDIVTVQMSGGLVTRRVVASDGIDAGRLITLQADTSAAPESVGVLFTDKAAVVRAYVPLAGYAAELGERGGRIILGIALLAAAVAVRTIVRRPHIVATAEMVPMPAL